jgi:hypothetical protein
MESKVPQAVFSECTQHGEGCESESCAGRLYRYYLQWPTGVNNNRIALGVFANPSTADATKLDPTLKRWREYCRAWGYGWSATVNVRAWRATNPDDVPADPVAIGKENMECILSAAALSDLIVLGYGKLGGELGLETVRHIRAVVTPQQIHCLKLNLDGSPAHPLYLRKDLTPIEFKGVSL